jgi:hypothetical protein
VYTAQSQALADLPRPLDPKKSSWVYFLDSGSLLKFKSVVHMCEKVGGKRPDFWPLAKALAAVFTLVCSFINAAGQAEAACAAALEYTPHLMHSCWRAAIMLGCKYRKQGFFCENNN